MSHTYAGIVAPGQTLMIHFAQGKQVRFWTDTELTCPSVHPAPYTRTTPSSHVHQRSRPAQKKKAIRVQHPMVKFRTMAFVHRLLSLIWVFKMMSQLLQHIWLSQRMPFEHCGAIPAVRPLTAVDDIPLNQ